MPLEVVLSRSGHLQADELRMRKVTRQALATRFPSLIRLIPKSHLVTPLLESGDDVTDESSLDTVRLRDGSKSRQTTEISKVYTAFRDGMEGAPHLDHDVSLFGRHFDGCFCATEMVTAVNTGTDGAKRLLSAHSQVV